MLLTKPLCVFCLSSVLRRACARQSGINNEFYSRTFSSKKSKNHNKNQQTIKVIAKNDYVTNQLNSSISKHLKRQQKMYNHHEEEERKYEQKLYYQNQRRDYDFDITDEFQRVGKHYRKSGHHGKIQYFHDKSNDRNNKNPANKNDVISSKSNERNTNENGFSDNDSDDYDVEQLQAPNWEDIDLVTINKNLYKSSDVTESRSAVDIQEFRTKFHIKTSSNALSPIFRFDEINELSPEIIAEIQRQGFDKCTPIQSQGIPLVLSGDNTIAIAQSGSGKTMAMVLSALIHISKQLTKKPEDGPIAVILALTQEIAEQIQQTANEFCKKANIKSTVLCDNYSKLNDLDKKIEGELLITTPCHLYEFLRTKSINLERCSHFAIYEADKMVEMCFDEEIVQIDSQIRPDCQRIFWSTSWSSDLMRIAMADCIRLEVGNTSVIEASISHDIKQIIKFSEEKNKMSVLYEVIDDILSKVERQKTLVFAETPEKADRIVKLLKKRSCKCSSIHNRKSLAQRNNWLLEFENNENQFLVLTDLAAKNINFNKIFNIINFDMPYSITDYVQRVQRIRQLDSGTVYSIFTEEDGDLADDLISILQQSNQVVDPALFILKAANADSDNEISFAIPHGKDYKKYTIDNKQK